MNEPNSIPLGTICAYDYENQIWVEGDAAKPLLIAQLQSERTLLQSPRGPQFAGKYGVPAALEMVSQQLRALGVE
jgi:hypothetical protein